MMKMRNNGRNRIQQRIRNLGDEENYKYLETLEADTIKQTDRKGKKEKITSDERESLSKPNYVADQRQKRSELRHLKNTRYTS